MPGVRSKERDTPPRLAREIGGGRRDGSAMRVNRRFLELGGLPGRHRRRPRRRRPPGRRHDDHRRRAAAVAARHRSRSGWASSSAGRASACRPACSPRPSRASCWAARSPSRRGSRWTAGSACRSPSAGDPAGHVRWPGPDLGHDRLRRRSSSTPRRATAGSFEAGNTGGRTPVVEASARSLSIDAGGRHGWHVFDAGRDAWQPHAADRARSTTCH